MVSPAAADALKKINDHRGPLWHQKVIVSALDRLKRLSSNLRAKSARQKRMDLPRHESMLCKERLDGLMEQFKEPRARLLQRLPRRAQDHRHRPPQTNPADSHAAGESLRACHALNGGGYEDPSWREIRH